jgi:hypothetical protein
MNSIGADLHKRIITVRAIKDQLFVSARKSCTAEARAETVDFCRQIQVLKVAIENTASYRYFVDHARPLADGIVLANLRKLRVVAEFAEKMERLGAQALAEFLARDMIPPAMATHAQAASAWRFGASQPPRPGLGDRHAKGHRKHPERLQRRPSRLIREPPPADVGVNDR